MPCLKVVITSTTIVAAVTVADNCSSLELERPRAILVIPVAARAGVARGGGFSERRGPLGRGPGPAERSTRADWLAMARCAAARRRRGALPRALLALMVVAGSAVGCAVTLTAWSGAALQPPTDAGRRALFRGAAAAVTSATVVAAVAPEEAARAYEDWNWEGLYVQIEPPMPNCRRVIKNLDPKNPELPDLVLEGVDGIEPNGQPGCEKTSKKTRWTASAVIQPTAATDPDELIADFTNIGGGKAVRGRVNRNAEIIVFEDGTRWRAISFSTKAKQKVLRFDQR
ncbi:unnamed protein product [Prorocentrum cordatum]|uniref:Uncharacterized protein n=1 Tax=Prorocentrum cordatum TaxID=2364126 RepID=A0ABN9QF23_9DINO|nr:unnamed protein product [Polarella glacialis]